jgi:pimeloyl-ACP methyl ester carboxylesterase
VHRDLKPENLFLVGGQVKVLDFGLAKHAMPAEIPSGDVQTEAGALLGTVDYMAPEQVRGLVLDPRADLFALGAVLHECVTGRPAFRASSPVATAFRIAQEELPPLEGAPAGLAQFVERCLAKAPADRFPSAAEAAHALVAARSGAAPEPRRAFRPPTTQYARVGDVHLAYQVFGDGPAEILIVPGFVSNIEALWDDPESARFFMRLAERARVAMFDKRGMGLSDRVVDAEAASQIVRAEDVRAIADAAGMKRPIVIAVSEGVSISILFAATYTERLAGLVLHGGFARSAQTPGYVKLTELVRHEWGSGRTLELYAPGAAKDPAKVKWWARWERMAASPGAGAAYLALVDQIDVVEEQPFVRAPTLIMHRKGDLVVPVQASRYIATHIPAARYLELDGDAHLPMIDGGDQIADEVIAFVAEVTAHPPALRPPAKPAVVAILDDAGTCTIDRQPDAHAALGAASAAIAKTPGARAGIQVERARGASAEQIARALAACATAGEILVTAIVRGQTIDTGATFVDRGTPTLIGERPGKIFAIGR